MKFYIVLFVVWSTIRCELEQDEGKCHSTFIECEAVCEFTCNSSAQPAEVGKLAGVSDIQAMVPWHTEHGAVTYVDRDRKPPLLDTLTSVHGKNHRSDAASQSLLTRKFQRYAEIAHEDQKLISWSCADHCRYECMHHVSAPRAEQGLEPLKFFGKWPFRRVLICQEILSSVYSIFNGLSYFAFSIWSLTHTARIEYKVFAFAMSLAWVASAVFHCRDTTMTMYMDYFSAFAGVVSNLALAVIRSTGWGSLKVLSFFSLLWILHVSYLVFVEFDFEWNMIVAIVVGLGSGITWLVWFIRNRTEIPHAWMVLVVTWGTSPLLVLFELNDFPPGPMGLADAHSYWHLTTIPISAISGLFLYRDTMFLRRQKSV
jgi:post-GPI attachment to proteins factor 3